MQDKNDLKSIKFDKHQSKLSKKSAQNKNNKKNDKSNNDNKQQTRKRKRIDTMALNKYSHSNNNRKGKDTQSIEIDEQVQQMMIEANENQQKINEFGNNDSGYVPDFHQSLKEDLELDFRNTVIKQQKDELQGNDIYTLDFHGWGIVFFLRGFCVVSCVCVLFSVCDACFSMCLETCMI